MNMRKRLKFREPQTIESWKDPQGSPSPTQISVVCRN